MSADLTLESPPSALVREAWTCREADRDRARDLAWQVKRAAPEDRLLALSSDVVIAYGLMREGNLAEALGLMLPAMAWFEETGELYWLTRALNVHNCVTAELGDFDSSIVGLGRQLRLSQQNGDPEMEGCALHDLGAMHLMRDPARAEELLRASLEVFVRAGFPEGESYALLNLTQVCTNAGRFSEARELLRRTLLLARAHGIEYVETHALTQQACLEFAAGALGTAEALFEEVLQRNTARGDRPLSEAMPSLVALYRASGRLQVARERLESHLKDVAARTLLVFEMQAHDLLTEILEELGDVAGALEHSRAYIRLYRRIYTAEQENKVRALEVLHRTEFMQRQTEAERHKNAQLAQALTELEAANRRALEISLTDELTGVRNRRYLMNLDLTHPAGEAHAAAEAHTVAILDIDFFKRINDQHGHDGGDLVLKEFVTLLKTELRPGDTVARFGGEEFVIVLPATALDTAGALLRRLSAQVRAHTWRGVPLKAPLTFTAGAVRCRDANLLDALKRADALLYQGKAEGRDGVWLEKSADRE